MSTALLNGKVYIDREKFAEAIFIENGLIKAVGSNEEILLMVDKDTEKIDCKNKTVLPGFNDSHMHFMQLGETMNQAQIADCSSIDEIIEVCRKFINDYPDKVKKGLHASGWNQDQFGDSDKMPDRFDLDKISTDIPIVLERVCGHIVSSNTKIIEMLGIDGNSPQFPEGSFLIGKDGYPSGIYTGNACNIVKNLIPDFTMEQRRDILIETMKYVVSKGVTSVQSNDVGTVIMDGPGAFKMFHEVYDSGKALLRYRHQVCFNNLDEFKKYLTVGEYFDGKYDKDSWLTLGPLKLFKDGSLGARTALMRNGYADDPSNHGLEWMSNKDMEE
ncbi:MAG: amidohydrolase family protein, partial [Eubacteriales bacterium]